MYYLLEKQGRILWPGFLHYLPPFRGAEVTDSKRAKNNDPLKKQKIYMFNTNNKRKKHQTIPEDKEKEKLDLKHVLQWPVTSKPWAICSKVDQRRSSSMFLFRNNLLLISPSHAWQQYNLTFRAVELMQCVWWRWYVSPT